MNTTSSFRDILDILACPKCRGHLEILEKNQCPGLACAACGVVYPVRDDIPVLLVEEALSKEDWESGGCGPE